jgi:hypothetical protein
MNGGSSSERVIEAQIFSNTEQSKEVKEKK